MSEQADIHARLMSRYAQVPDWWYLVIFCALIASDTRFSERIEPNLLLVQWSCLLSGLSVSRFGRLTFLSGDLYSLLQSVSLMSSWIRLRWSLFILQAFFYIIPIGMIQAITNQQVGLKYVFSCICDYLRTSFTESHVVYSVIAELIVGYLLPGKPIAMMMFKTYGYITMSQGKFVVLLLHSSEN